MSAPAAPGTLSDSQRREFTSEAENQLYAVFDALASHHGSTGELPPAIPPTASQPPCRPQAWPTDAPAAWTRIGFRPAGELRYAYAIVPDTGSGEWLVRAVGDLDCDGTTSTFELRVGVVDGKLVQTTELTRVDPLE